MRVTSGMLVNDAMSNIKKGMERLKQSQDRATTLKRVAKPSDDPVAAEILVKLGAEHGRLEQYARNLQKARAFADQTDSSLSHAVELLSRARELAVQGLNSGLNPMDLTIMSKEAGELKEQMVGLANAKQGDVYIFAGYKTDTVPFDQDGNYSGDDGEIQLDIAPGIRATINRNGQDVFVDGGVFSALEELRTALQGADRGALKNALDSVNQALDHTIQVQGGFGAEAACLDDAEKSLETRKVELAEYISKLGDADFAEAITQYLSDTRALETAMKVSSKTLGLSILDFLG